MEGRERERKEEEREREQETQVNSVSRSPYCALCDPKAIIEMKRVLLAVTKSKDTGERGICCPDYYSVTSVSVSVLVVVGIKAHVSYAWPFHFAPRTHTHG